MGVKGLKTFLERRSDLVNLDDEEILHDATTLLIDAAGFAMFIMDMLINEGHLRSDISAVYKFFGDQMEAYLHEIREEYNITPIFYFDGPLTKGKAMTAEKRAAQREAKWQQYFDSTLEDGTGEDEEIKIYTFPVLMMTQLKFTLNKMQIKCINCEYEADWQIAADCYKWNLDKDGETLGRERAFIYANDTDFMVFRDVAYIKFGGLVFYEDGRLGAEKVFRRAQISADLGMSEPSFVRYCILMGNDFTESFKRTCFSPLFAIGGESALSASLEGLKISDSTTESTMESDEEGGSGEGQEAYWDASSGKLTKKMNKHHMEARDMLFACCQAAHQNAVSQTRPHFEISASTSIAKEQRAELQLWIDFSLHMYELHDIYNDDKYPFDPSRNNDDKEEIDALSDKFLSKAEKAHLTKWSTKHAEKFGRYHISNDVLSYLKEAVRRDKMYQGGSNTGSLGVISQVHLRAFELMRELMTPVTDSYGNIEYDEDGDELFPKNGYGGLYWNEDDEDFEEGQWGGKGPNPDYQLGERSSDLEWEHIMAGHWISLIYRSFLKMDSNGIPTMRRKAHLQYVYDQYDIQNSPAVFFDEVLFHTIVHQLEGENYGKDGNGASIPVFDDYLINGAGRPDGAKPVEEGKETLPIHFHKERILGNIVTDRVTIIHGETGCGKSSGLPVMILNDADEKGGYCKMMVSQPRRIAAASLMKRLRITLKDRVGMRMGHGVRDESENCNIIFVTTGYIVRLLAHHPEAFKEHTHLIIDEVHERSVDSDVLCLLARRLLLVNKNIKLILMSATIHTELYKAYFSDYEGQDFGSLECLSVGARRFPLDIRYLDDLAEGKVRGLTAMHGTARKMMDEFYSNKGLKADQVDSAPAKLAEQQYKLVMAIVKAMVPTGTGVLIFVSGIQDITELMEKFEGMPKFIVIGIHSDIPYEEQEVAFDPCPKDKVKVIVATNAAESSITLPDVDTVVCLGTQKALRYDPKHHRVNLVNCYISKASSTQRAGRTGRVRPGNVYRLYTQRFFEETMNGHDVCEVKRVPLQDVILSLRTMLEDSDHFEGVVPLLTDMLEPPSVDNISKSFNVLHEANMIETNDDDGKLTSIGRMAGQLPIDLRLGRMVSLGILLGIGPEACVLAMALSIPKSVFRIASPLIHSNPDELNYIVSQTFLGMHLMDNGMYSEPLMLFNIYLHWKKCSVEGNKRHQFCDKLGLVFTRVKQFASSVDHLLERVAKGLEDQAIRRHRLEQNQGGMSPVRGKGQPKHVSDAISTANNTYNTRYLTDLYPNCAQDFSQSMLNRLRLILVWALGSSMVVRGKKNVNPSIMNKSFDEYHCVTPQTNESELSFKAQHLPSLIPFPKAAGYFDLQVTVKKSYEARASRERFLFNKPDVLVTDICHSMMDEDVHMVGVMQQISGGKGGDASKVGSITIGLVGRLEGPSNEDEEEGGNEKVSSNAKDTPLRFIAGNVERFAVMVDLIGNRLPERQPHDVVDRGFVCFYKDPDTEKCDYNSNVIIANDLETLTVLVKSKGLDTSKCQVTKMYMIVKPAARTTKDFKDLMKLSPSVYMNMPARPEANAILTVNGVEVSPFVVRTAFYTRSFDESHPDNKKCDGKFREYNNSSQKKIQFPNPLVHGYHALQGDVVEQNGLNANQSKNGNKGGKGKCKKAANGVSTQDAFFPVYQKALLEEVERSRRLKLQLQPTSNDKGGSGKAGMKGGKKGGKNGSEKESDDVDSVVPFSVANCMDYMTRFNRPLLDDIPVGMRILSSIQYMYKDKQIRLWDDPPDQEAANKHNHGRRVFATPSPKSDKDNNGGPNKGATIPGSKEWFEAKEKAKAAEEEQSNPQKDNGRSKRMDPAVEKYRKNCKFAMLTQEYRMWNPASGGTVSGKALMGRQNLSTSALHLGTGTMFGIAGNTMNIGMDGALVVCDAVTLLPPGNRWLHLALLCICGGRMDPRMLNEAFCGPKSNISAGVLESCDLLKPEARRLHFLEDYRLSHHELFLTDLIDHSLKGFLSVDTEACDNLIFAIDWLFKYWSMSDSPNTLFTQTKSSNEKEVEREQTLIRFLDLLSGLREIGKEEEMDKYFMQFLLSSSSGTLKRTMSSYMQNNDMRNYSQTSLNKMGGSGSDSDDESDYDLEDDQSDSDDSDYETADDGEGSADDSGDEYGYTALDYLNEVWLETGDDPPPNFKGNQGGSPAVLQLDIPRDNDGKPVDITDALQQAEFGNATNEIEAVIAKLHVPKVVKASKKDSKKEVKKGKAEKKGKDKAAMPVKVLTKDSNQTGKDKDAPSQEDMSDLYESLKESADGHADIGGEDNEAEHCLDDLPAQEVEALEAILRQWRAKGNAYFEKNVTGRVSRHLLPYFCQDDSIWCIKSYRHDFVNLAALYHYRFLDSKSPHRSKAAPTKGKLANLKRFVKDTADAYAQKCVQLVEKAQQSLMKIREGEATMEMLNPVTFEIFKSKDAKISNIYSSGHVIAEPDCDTKNKKKQSITKRITGMEEHLQSVSEMLAREILMEKK